MKPGRYFLEVLIYKILLVPPEVKANTKFPRVTFTRQGVSTVITFTKTDEA